MFTKASRLDLVEIIIFPRKYAELYEEKPEEH